MSESLLTLHEAKERTAEIMRHWRRDPDVLSPDEQAMAAVIDELNERLYGITPDVVAHTLDRDMRAGETVQVRLSKPFLPR